MVAARPDGVLIGAGKLAATNGAGIGRVARGGLVESRDCKGEIGGELTLGVGLHCVGSDMRPVWGLCVGLGRATRETVGCPLCGACGGA